MKPILKTRTSPGAMLFALVLLAFSGNLPAQNKGEILLACAESLVENQKLTLSTRDEHGKWRKVTNIILDNSQASEWKKVPTGEIHLVENKDGKKTSLGHFNVGEADTKTLVALVADRKNGTYQIHSINIIQDDFDMGDTILLNFSQLTAKISLGERKITVPPGGRTISKPGNPSEPTYQMTVSYADAGNNDVMCYDRFVITNPSSRKILFLLPDQNAGIKVLSLPVFGEPD